MRVISVLAAAGAGAAGMYLCDPVLGRARRTALRDRTRHGMRVTHRWLLTETLSVRNHAAGYVAEHRPALIVEQPPDEVLVERIRSEMGHVLRHAHRVTVTARAGWVELRGHVLVGERRALMDAVRKVPGVHGIDDYLDEHGWVGADRFVAS